MPFYDYKCKSCGQVYPDQQFSIADRLEPTKHTCTECDELTIILMIGAPAIGDSVRLGIKKPDPAFQNHLKHITKSMPGANKDVRYTENITSY